MDELMFNQIFVENDVYAQVQTQAILKKFKHSKVVKINKIEEVFGKVKKPYLQKRSNLNLFLGNKKGQLLKEAPVAYGLKGEPHYYFVHAYNCIYECTYCYLQGHFHSPDIVLFLNHKEIGEEIIKLSTDHKEKGSIWFHAGEFSDSLALSHITNELPYYFELFSKIDNAKLELRTKSANIRPLLELPPSHNIIISFSLSPEDKIKSLDLKTPPLKSRLRAIEKLHNTGHPIGIHFDPVVYEENILEKYDDLVKALVEAIPGDKIEYLSLGVVRFTKEVYFQMKNNYPETEFLGSEMVKSFDGKLRYSKPLRLWMLNKIKDICLSYGIYEKNIYLCMENDDEK